MKLSIVKLLFVGLLFTFSANAQDSTKSKKGKVPPEEYIIKKDSSKLVGNVKRKKSKIFLDDQEYKISDLLGYKEGNHYHAIFGDKIYWVWALGKIQAYSQWETIDLGTTYNANNNSMTDHRETNSICYMRKGNGPMIMYTTKTLLDLIQDNDEAVKEFHDNYKKVNDNMPSDLFYHKLKKVLAVYNGNTPSTF